MFDKLEAVEKRYSDLEGLLADPDVIGKREDALLLGGMLEKQGVHRLNASDGLRNAFIEAAAAAREQLDDKLIPTALVKESLDVLATYRSGKRKPH